MSTKESRRRLHELLAERSVRQGHFVLASGRTSNVYVDARLTTMSPEGMVLIGSLALESFAKMGWKPDSIGGLTLGADPVAYAISYTSFASVSPLRAFTIRKQPKGHGLSRQIEGPFRAGDKVVIVEDVITTGQSALQAIEVATGAGAEVLGVLAVVDRQENGRENLEARGYAVVALSTLADLIPLSSSSDSGGV
jgi:orotate phosphoribosyltransferase